MCGDILKTSIEVPDELMNKIKEYNLIHKGRPINMSGMFQECLETIFRKEQSPDKLKVQQNFKNIESDPEIIIESSLSLEAMRKKWWDDKQIGISIAKAGGIEIINLKNIIQKNPDLFETKEECKLWLHNKLKSDPPPEIIKETPYKKGIIPNQNHTRKKDIISSEDTTEPPKFSPRRTTIKCPGCGEEHLELPGSTNQKCPNCGYIKQPNQHAPAQVCQ